MRRRTQVVTVLAEVIEPLAGVRRALEAVEKTLVTHVGRWAPGLLPQNYQPNLEKEPPHWLLCIRQIADAEGTPQLYVEVRGRVAIPDALTAHLVRKARTWQGTVPQVFARGSVLSDKCLLEEDDGLFPLSESVSSTP